jgi:hypothetical protein
MESITMSVASDNLDAGGLQDLTFDLCAALNNEGGMKATIGEREGLAGVKGDTIEIGKIILTLVGSGGVVIALVNVLKSYVERGRSIKIELRRENGKSVRLTADDLDNPQLEQARKLVREFFRD